LKSDNGYLEETHWDFSEQLTLSISGVRGYTGKGAY
jgi:hypothetical protein